MDGWTDMRIDVQYGDYMLLLRGAYKYILYEIIIHKQVFACVVMPWNQINHLVMNKKHKVWCFVVVSFCGCCFYIVWVICHEETLACIIYLYADLHNYIACSHRHAWSCIIVLNITFVYVQDKPLQERNIRHSSITAIYRW